MKEMDFKSMKGQAVKVMWMDAYGEMGKNKSELTDTPFSYLIPTETYGTIYNTDDMALMILTEDSAITCDYTVIPLGMIEDVTILKGGKEYGK